MKFFEYACPAMLEGWAVRRTEWDRQKLGATLEWRLDAEKKLYAWVDGERSYIGWPDRWNLDADDWYVVSNSFRPRIDVSKHLTSPDAPGPGVEHDPELGGFRYQGLLACKTKELAAWEEEVTRLRKKLVERDARISHLEDQPAEGGLVAELGSLVKRVLRGETAARFRIADRLIDSLRYRVIRLEQRVAAQEQRTPQVVYLNDGPRMVPCSGLGGPAWRPDGVNNGTAVQNPTTDPTTAK